MQIEGNGTLRDGAEFRFTSPTRNKAASTFTAILKNKVIVARCFDELRGLAPDTPVIAHWHGQYRTDAFLSTVGELRQKAAEESL